MVVSPILLNSLPFDATEKYMLYFSYSGSQVFGHRIIVKTNDTLEQVYDSGIIESMALTATIPENTLENGITYRFQVSVICLNTEDGSRVESSPSNTVILKCVATPEFGFVDIEEGATIRNSYFDAQLFFSCEDPIEILNQYKVILYASDTTTSLYDSGTIYANSGLTVRISGLTDLETYYLRATGETLSGMELDTGLIQIRCNYIKPDLFLAFYADNVPEDGLVQLSSNFVMVEGATDAESLIYVDDEKVNLSNGDKVYFEDGFTATNFTCKIIAESINDFSTVITFDMVNAQAYVMWCKGIFEGEETETYYAELVAYSYIGYERLNYIQLSNRIEPPNDDEQVYFWIRHVDGCFDIKIEKLTIEEVAEVIEEGGVE